MTIWQMAKAHGSRTNPFFFALKFFISYDDHLKLQVYLERKRMLELELKVMS